MVIIKGRKNNKCSLGCGETKPLNTAGGNAN
jgi:hypothetical protein